MTSKLSAMFLPGDDSKTNKSTWMPKSSKKAQLANPKSTGANPEEEEQQNTEKKDQGAVRFAPEDEEIDPLDESRRRSGAGGVENEELSPEAHEQIRNLAMSLQKSRLQENRMANFAYETVSMPPSRVRGMLSILVYPADRTLLQ